MVSVDPLTVAEAVAVVAAVLVAGWRLGRRGRDAENVEEKLSERMDIQFESAARERRRIRQRLDRVHDDMDTRFETIHDIVREKNHCAADYCPYCESDDEEDN